MSAYVARRLLATALTLLGVSVLVFGMVRLVPGTIVEQLLGQAAMGSPEVLASLPYLLRGAAHTVMIAAAVTVLGTAAGVAVGLLRFTPWPWLGRAGVSVSCGWTTSGAIGGAAPSCEHAVRAPRARPVNPR